MPRLSELSNLKNEAIPDEQQVESLDQLQETGSFLPMLQPGVYEFQIPANVDEVYSLVDEHQQEWKAESTGVQYLKAAFDDAHPLKITGAPPAMANRVGEPFRANVTNVPRDWKVGGVPTKVKDFLYLLKKLGHKVVPKTTKDYVDALSSYAGKTFKSPIDVSWGCNKKRKARFWVVDAAHPAGAEVESVQPGCGNKLYPTKDVKPGPDGQYPEKVQCPKCSAILRGFANLDLLREV